MAVTLRYFEEMDCASDYESTLGLSNGALRGILGRALMTMRKRLRPASGSPGETSPCLNDTIHEEIEGWLAADSTNN